MGAEVLEEGTVEPFMADYETKCSGKKVALLGSYGWGDGQCLSVSIHVMHHNT
ncbi:hypothetical protein [Butyrivibrio sp. TB]|uniref:hypothetical protein n=1 Tax=Butyrivibrio sp. TB TaxID=1520809 RepID=UPI0008AE9CD0|nr:hypothetical protein [Butyrivibrio sp. TB]SEQ30600.1 hypothetical protein SAMN02910382_02574 [Butyrivibrio sp. TB]